MKYLKQFEHITSSIGPSPLKQLYISYNSQPIGTLSQNNGRFYFDEDYIKENNTVGVPSKLLIELAELIKKTIV